MIYRGLNKSLGKSEVSLQDSEALITSATQFIRFATVEPKTEGKKAIRSKHIFSEIHDFDLKATFNLCIDMIHTCRTEAFDHVVKEFKKENKGPEKASSGYSLGSTLSGALGRLSIWSNPPVSDDEEDEELEHRDDQKMTSH
ncbi:MAG: hypothetical protein ACRCXC_07115 [Legionella sp.]